MPISEEEQQAFIVQLGQNIAKIREGKGLSQEKLAEESGLTRNFVSLIECGDTNPSILNLLAVATALNTEIAQLLETKE